MTGELVEQDYHLELRGLLHGPGTRYSWDGPWVGLGLPATKSQDVELDQANGSYPGRDYLTSRLLTFPVAFGGSSPADVMLDLLELTEAWSPSLVDLELHGQLPGWGHFHVVGRPRGLIEDLSNLKSGEGRAMATFVAHDPTIYFD